MVQEYHCIKGIICGQTTAWLYEILIRYGSSDYLLLFPSMSFRPRQQNWTNFKNWSFCMNLLLTIFYQHTFRFLFKLQGCGVKFGIYWTLSDLMRKLLQILQNVCKGINLLKFKTHFMRHSILILSWGLREWVLVGEVNKSD